MAEFNRQLTADVKCVIMTHVSNVFGYILPLNEVAERCQKAGVPLVVDASQSAGCLPVSVKKWRAAYIAMPGHKGLYGPQGTGLLLCGRMGRPFFRGGTGSSSERQEMPDFLPDRLEAGTHNVCGIAGLLEGITYVKKRGVKNICCHEQKLRKATASVLSKLDGVEVFEAGDSELQSGVLSFRTGKMDCEVLGERLAARGVAVRAGLHCAPYAHRTAGTMETGTVRVSFSDFNTEREAACLGKVLAGILFS